jgi:dipeptidase E
VNYGQEFLEHAVSDIKDFLGAEIKRVLFVPFAGVTRSYDEYAAAVRGAFAEMGYLLDSVHEAVDPVKAVRSAEALAVGGGNTFHLLRELYERRLIESIRERVEAGDLPYIGWSAGSNVACPTIRTTNDMPIVEPASFNALNLVPFQINPHYTDEKLTAHSGETREQRLAEFTKANPDATVVGLREGSILRIEGQTIKLLGEKTARVFKCGEDAREIEPADSLGFLLTAYPARLPRFQLCLRLTFFSSREMHDQHTYRNALSGPTYLIRRSVSVSHLSQRLTFSSSPVAIAYSLSASLICARRVSNTKRSASATAEKR